MAGGVLIVAEHLERRIAPSTLEPNAVAEHRDPSVALVP